jgi:hypothetical protein
MRRPRRLSRPTTRERRRPRIEPSDRPASFKGIWTRRPSARIAMATWRRLRPSNRPKIGLPHMPGRSGRFAQSTRRSVIMQPRANGLAELGLGPRWAGRQWALADPPGNGLAELGLDLGGPTSGRWRRGAPPLTSVGRLLVSSRRSAICSPQETAINKRPSVARRSLPHQFDPRVEGDSLPALSRLENDGGASHSRQDQENPEGLSLQRPSHLIKTSAGRRRG